MVPLNCNNQKHLQLIDFICKKKVFFLSFFRNIAHLHFSPKILVNNISAKYSFKKCFLL